MGIPERHHPCWAKLAKGELDRVPTQSLSLQLLRQRLSRSQASVEGKADEIHQYFVKFERILETEIKYVSKL